MPIYQYKCENCGEQFDVIQKFADEPLAVHATCGGAVHKMMTAPAFQFKGTGWYVTDYANKSSAPSEGNSGGGNSGKDSAESKSDSKADAKSESKAESKSETKAESKSESKSDSTSAPAPATPAKA
jgi:putative FmdB family regulatory protein